MLVPERRRLTLPIRDWAKYVAVGERYHISAIVGRLIIKNVVYDYGAGVAAFAPHGFVALHNRLW
jgi:hypothetical protein